MIFKENKAVKDRFEQYPDGVRDKMLSLRQLVIETAKGIDEVIHLEETFKWGEPSYIANKGTTLRMDWKAKDPDHYAIYFTCTSMMIPSIKKIFGNIFKYEGNRAMLFEIDQKIPSKELKKCVSMALTYHKYKHLPFLGH